MKDNEKQRRMANKGTGFREREKIVNDVAFKILKIVAGWEGRNLNNKTMRPNFQPSNSHKFIRSKCQARALIRKIAMKIFMEETGRSEVAVMGKCMKIMTNNITDRYLNFDKNLEIYRKTSIPEKA